jgi:hypothetical protein
MTRVLFAVVLAAALAAAAPAQNAPTAGNPQVLTIDFVAFGPTGTPVLDLRPEEVSVRIGARDRAVRGLEVVRLAASADEEIPPPFASSTLMRPRNRSMVIVLDDESVRPGREGAFRPAVGRLLASLAPSDRVAVVTMPLGGIRLDFTTDHVKAREVFNSLGGKAPRRVNSSEFACRSRRTLEMLAGLLQNLGATEGPTAVVFVSSSLSGPTRDAPTTTIVGGRVASIGAGQCEIVADKFEEVGIAAAAARATFHVLQPEDQIIAPGTVAAGDLAGSTIAEVAAGLEHLAGVTGSELLRLSGEAGDTIERILRHSSTYYLATIESDAGDRGVTRLEIRTTRPDVTVRARPRIALTRPSPEAGRKSAVTPRDMLRQARPYREFALRALAFVSSNPGDARLRVIAVAEAEPSARLNALAVGLFDGGGKLIGQWTAQPEELTGSTVMAAMLAPPGRYRLRVAATDEGGRAATADYDLHAVLERAGPIRMSGLVLGVSREGTFFPRMIFSTEPTAIAQVELLDLPRGAMPSGRLEIARSLNGPAIASMPAAITPTEDASRAMLTAVIPLGALPAGDYVIRAIVSSPDGPSGRVVRTLRKVG